MKTRSSTRRQFLKQAGTATAGAVAFPYIVPSSALGKDGAVAPSDRVIMAWIGTGGQGRGLMSNFLAFPEVQVVAACDVDESRLAEGLGRVNERYGNEDCKGYHDFRQLLARKDIDAVVVATPDHWHALASVAALDSGKDVYCEKPLANSIYESRKIVDAVKRNNRVLQVGSMERSNEKCRRACELVHAGAIGKLHTIHIWRSRPRRWGPSSRCRRGSTGRCGWDIPRSVHSSGRPIRRWTISPISGGGSSWHSAAAK
jgi:predicted dehydrogenase